MTALPILRPATRADCVGGARPCPCVTCKFHTLIDSVSVTRIEFNPGLGLPALELKWGKWIREGVKDGQLGSDIEDPDDVIVDAISRLPHSCVLDAVEATK